LAFDLFESQLQLYRIFTVLSRKILFSEIEIFTFSAHSYSVPHERF